MTTRRPASETFIARSASEMFFGGRAGRGTCGGSNCFASGTSNESPMSKETSNDDPRQQSDWRSTKQTDEPWKGIPEKDQCDPFQPKPDIEKWNGTNTH
jgi:hypothetical protein